MSTYQELRRKRQKADPIRTIDSWDVAREMEKGIVETINDELASLLNGKYKDKSFYLVLIMHIETIAKVPKSIVMGVEACPFPRLMQTVWKYDHKDEKIEFLWTLPDKKIANAILNDPLGYLNAGGDTQLMQFVFDLKNGKLKQISDRENGYKKDMAVIIKDPEDLAEDQRLMQERAING